MNSFITLLATGGAAEGGTSGNPLSMVFIIGAMFAVMYFTMIRPQKKKQKEEQAMRDNLQLGDEITTIGGIMGRVVTIKEDSITIETGAGSERSKLKLARWAMSTNNTAAEKAESERKAAREAEEAAKAARIEENAGKSKKKKSKKDNDSLDI